MQTTFSACGIYLEFLYHIFGFSFKLFYVGIAKIWDMNTQKKNKDMGTMGETYVLERLRHKGFLLYKRNIRQWGFEIDLVVYRYNENTMFLEVRVVEVKTRMAHGALSYPGTLDQYGLEGKWARVRSRLYRFRDEVAREKGLDMRGGSAHFDLAIVFLKLVADEGYPQPANPDIENLLKMHTYIKDINLFI